MSHVSISDAKIAHAKAIIPEEDFAAAQYDFAEATPQTRRLVILSTPRSGSTFLCDLIRRNGICIPHEYFQPQGYLPYLADRWGTLQDSTLDLPGYVNALGRYRTSATGILGVNLHGAHLAFFQQAEPHLPDVPVDYVVVQRRNRLKQAISYEIAGQTSRWSSAFKGDKDPEYSFERLVQRVDNLDRQALLLEAFLQARQATAVTIAYEDLVADPEGQLRRIPCFAECAELVTGAALTRQSSQINAEWAERFAADLLASPGLKPAARPASLMARGQRVGTRLLSRLR